MAERKIEIVIAGDWQGGRAVDKADKDLGRLSGSAKTMGGALIGAFSGVAIFEGVKAIGRGIGSTIDAARESIAVNKQTEQVVKTMGDAANASAPHIADLATKISNLTGIDDELIQQGANVVRTFGNVRNEAGKGNDIFDRTVAAANDMSKALGTDMQSASIQLGKALNDPVRGMTALTRSGVSFTQAQKDQVKAMVESGDTLGAQRLIMAEVEKQFGGTAAAVATPWDKLKVTFGNIQETIGMKLIPILDLAASWIGERLPGAIAFLTGLWRTLSLGISALIAAFKDGDVTSDGFVGAMERIGVKAREVWDALQPVFSAVIGFFRENPAAGFAVLGAIIGGVLLSAIVAVGAAVLAALSPFVLITAAVAALAAGVAYAYTRWGWFRDAVDAVWQALQTAWDAITTAFNAGVDALSALWDRFGETIIERARGFLDGLVTMFQGLWEILSGIFDLVKAILTGKWGEAWDAIVKILHGVWDVITGYIQQVLNVVAGILQIGLGLLGELWSAGWNLLSSVVASVGAAILQWFTDLPGRILGFFTAAISWLVQGGKDILTGLYNGIVEAAGNVWTWLTNLPGTILGYVVTAIDWLKQAGRDLINGLIAGAEEIIAGIADWMTSVGTKIVNAFKNFFGMHSPSTVFKSLGRYMMEGLRDGLIEGSDAVGAVVHKIGLSASDLAEKFDLRRGFTLAQPGHVLADAMGGMKVGGTARKLAGVERWRDVALQALAYTGSPATWIDSLLRRMNQESGGNPAAINLWDSNARKGMPSQGLMQTIPSTFRHYAAELAGRGILDPFANIVASIRYANARYGSAPAGWNRSGGYAKGAWEIMSDQIASIHRGEMVVPAGPAETIRRALDDGGSHRPGSPPPLHLHFEGITDIRAMGRTMSDEAAWLWRVAG